MTFGAWTRRASWLLHSALKGFQTITGMCGHGLNFTKLLIFIHYTRHRLWRMRGIYQLDFHKRNLQDLNLVWYANNHLPTRNPLRHAHCHSFNSYLMPVMILLRTTMTKNFVTFWFDLGAMLRIISILKVSGLVTAINSFPLTPRRF